VGTAARLRGGTKGVLLALVDCWSGVVWPPVTARDEAAADPWGRRFRRAKLAGLDLRRVRGITSDGAAGLAAHRRRQLPWVSHQRCVFHLWRGLAGDLAQAATTASAGLSGAAATAVRTATRQTLVGLVRAV
jgi:hypothetical protein